LLETSGLDTVTSRTTGLFTTGAGTSCFGVAGVVGGGGCSTTGFEVSTEEIRNGGFESGLTARYTIPDASAAPQTKANTIFAFMTEQPLID